MRFPNLYVCLNAPVLAMILTAPTMADEAPDVAALRSEVARRGWLLFAAHPAEIRGGRIIGPKQERGQLDLYLARPDGSELRNITRTPALSEYGARFSPDGKRILYRRLPEGELVNHDLWGAFGELVIADADGGNPVAQGKSGEFPWASWNPTGDQIACLYKREGVIRIFDLATKRLLKEMPRQGIFQQLFWSPDGKRLCGTANVSGRRWNIVAIEIETQKLSLLSRLLNCTPDWFPKDSDRVIYSHRNPKLGAGLPANARKGEKHTYGSTMLVQASADGKSRTLVFADYENHAYFGRLSPDDKYLIFSTDPYDGLIVGDMHIIRMADTPMVRPGFEAIKELYPDAEEGPILDLRLPTGAPLRGFEPDWKYSD